ncbi:MAG: hypothetical protein CMK09_18705 [Ponticaulis sp.]|nr:hypothetical protein [Ponticaulis sp.]|tara:strand:- start:115349 stop:116107 length:759 start_codon:yes stop_codon:yes gene_type:complete
MIYRAVFFSLCLLASSAHAEDEMVIAFDDGRYDEAFTLAAATSETADRYAFQARSLLAQAIHHGEQPPNEVLKRAESLAAKALQLDKRHLEGRIQLALALSMQTRVMSLSEINGSGYGTLSRDLAESILEDNPQNVWAHGFLSVWHIEARRVAGPFLSGMAGASVKDGQAHFEKSVETDPENLVVIWQYARALMALNPKKYDDEINGLLSDIRDLSPKDALEAVVKDRASRFETEMTSRNFDRVKSLAQTTL